MTRVVYVAAHSEPINEGGVTSTSVDTAKGEIKKMLVMGLSVAVLVVVVMIAVNAAVLYAAWKLVSTGMAMISKDADDKSAYAFITAAITLVITALTYAIPGAGKAVRILFGMSFEVYKFNNDVSGGLEAARTARDVKRKRNDYAIQMAKHFAVFNW